MNEIMSLVSCPAFAHDHENYKSRPCWGKLQQEATACTCTQCGAKYPMRNGWSLPILFPNYQDFIDLDEQIEKIESRNLNQLAGIKKDWYDNAKKIPLPKQGKRIFRKPWKEYVKEVADVIGLQVDFNKDTSDKGDVAIGTAENEDYIYEPKIYFSDFDYFVEYYKRLFQAPEIISDYIIACFAHEIGHLCPPSGGALDYLFYETNWGAENMKVNCYWGALLELWDESIANLNAITFYPNNSERMRYIAVSIYGGSGLLHNEGNENSELDQFDFTSDEALLKAIKNANPTVRIPSGYYDCVLSYMGGFSWFNLLNPDISKPFFSDIKAIDELLS